MLGHDLERLIGAQAAAAAAAAAAEVVAAAAAEVAAAAKNANLLQPQQTVLSERQTGISSNASNRTTSRVPSASA